MIGSFKSKVLQRLWFKGDLRGIASDHRRRVNTILSMLDSAEQLEDLNVPGYHLHKLKGLRAIRYSMRVSGNWRITFEWFDGAAEHIDYEDYH